MVARAATSPHERSSTPSDDGADANAVPKHPKSLQQLFLQAFVSRRVLSEAAAQELYKGLAKLCEGASDFRRVTASCTAGRSARPPLSSCLLALAAHELTARLSEQPPRVRRLPRGVQDWPRAAGARHPDGQGPGHLDSDARAGLSLGKLVAGILTLCRSTPYPTRRPSSLPSAGPKRSHSSVYWCVPAIPGPPLTALLQVEAIMTAPQLSYCQTVNQAVRISSDTRISPSMTKAQAQELIKGLVARFVPSACKLSLTSDVAAGSICPPTDSSHSPLDHSPN